MVNGHLVRYAADASMSPWLQVKRISRNDAPLRRVAVLDVHYTLGFPSFSRKPECIVE